MPCSSLELGTTDWNGSPQALPPSGLVGLLPEGTKEADKKVKGVPGTPNCPPLLWRRRPLSAQGETPPLVPPFTQSEALPLRDWVSRPLCPSPSSYFRLSRLVVLGFLPTSCAISAQPGCSLPRAPMGPARKPRADGVWGRRRVKLPSLSVCPGPFCCLDGAALPCPPSLGHVCLFCYFLY